MQHYAYSAFGKIVKFSDGSGNEVTSNPPVKTSYGFTNREHDSETGLMYYRARYYSPETGRFISSDPHAGKVKRPSTVINKYIYGVNNPIRFVDPDGKFAFLLGIALSGLASGYFADKRGGSFWEGFNSGIVSAATVTAFAFSGAYIGAVISGGFAGAFGAAVYGGTISTIVGATIGGIIGGRYNAINHLGVRDSSAIGVAGLLGGLGGLSLGIGGFSPKYGGSNLVGDKNNLIKDLGLGLSVQGCVWGDSDLQDGGETVDDGYGGTCMGPTEVNGN